MAQLANCPQCDHELFVPGEVSGDTRVRCPSCQSFFQLKAARSREIAIVDVTETAPNEPVEDLYTKQTVADLPSMATWSGSIEKLPDADSTTPFESPSLHIAAEADYAPPAADSETFDDSIKAMEVDELAADFESSERPEESMSLAEVEPPQPAELHVANINDNLIDSDRIEEESPEAAAQRIDAWFRSAKTLEDVPPVADDTAEKPMVERDRDFMPASADAADALDYHEPAEPEFREDFNLDIPADEPAEDVAAWDDSQHIDRLLAEIKEQPPDEYILASEEMAQEPAANHEDRAAVADQWMPDASYSMTASGREPGRKKSLLRTMVMTAVGGFMGLALGYYVLLWLGIDLLGAAHYLPQAMLPASLKSPQKVASAPAPPLSATPGTATTLASETPSTEASTTDQADSSKTDLAVEPAAFNEPGAAPVKLTEPAPIQVQITGAPSFTSDQFSAALQAGKDAEPNLVNGSLSDSRDVARLKGFSYSILADLAQKLTFTTLRPGEITNWELEGNQLFQKILANPHARDEIAQIVPKWIASPNRKQGGVFFAGNVESSQPQGSVTECTVEFGGQTLPVLLPATATEQLKVSAAPVAVIGWIVNEPAKIVAGYTGSAPKAVFANKLLPLE